MSKIRILFEGHDLKFLNHVMDHYKINHRYHVDVFTYEGHVIKDNREILRILPDIDIIFCEWGLGNLQWFSHNKLPGQKLVTRIHLQEFSTQYLAETKWENVDKAIVVGPYMKERFDQQFPGISDKCQVIFNLINTDSFSSEKVPDAQFNLGLLGILPMRKAPHLALEILRELHKSDKRYKLFIKGRRPEEVAWLWRRPEEQVYYNNFYESIARYGLDDSVFLEPHGQDVPEWFTKIGFILSPSEFESFHMAIAEGMASRAIPVIRNWTGSAALFPSKYIFSSLEEAVTLIRNYPEPDSFSAEGLVTRKYCTERFDVRIILPQYDHILLPDFKPAEIRKEYFYLLDQRNHLAGNLEQSEKLREKAAEELDVLIHQQKSLVESNSGLTSEIVESRKSVQAHETTIQLQQTTIQLQQTTIQQQQSAILEQIELHRKEQGKNLEQQETLKQQQDALMQQQESLKLQNETLKQQQEILQQQHGDFRRQEDALKQLIEDQNLQISVNQKYADQLGALEQELTSLNEVLKSKSAELEASVLQAQQLSIELEFAGELLKKQQIESKRIEELLNAENIQLRQNFARELEQLQKVSQSELGVVRDSADKEIRNLHDQFQRENKLTRELQDGEIARLGIQLYNAQYEHRVSVLRMEQERMRMQSKMDHLRDINQDLERRLLVTFGSLTWKVGAFLIKKPADLVLFMKRKLFPSK